MCVSPPFPQWCNSIVSGRGSRDQSCYETTQLQESSTPATLSGAVIMIYFSSAFDDNRPSDEKCRWPPSKGVHANTLMASTNSYCSKCEYLTWFMSIYCPKRNLNYHIIEWHIRTISNEFCSRKRIWKGRLVHVGQFLSDFTTSNALFSRINDHTGASTWYHTKPNHSPCGGNCMRFLCSAWHTNDIKDLAICIFVLSVTSVTSIITHNTHFLRTCIAALCPGSTFTIPAFLALVH